MNDDCCKSKCNVEDCVNKAAEFLSNFENVDNDLRIDKIANGFLVKIDGRTADENWITRQFAVPTIACAEQIFVAWAEHPRADDS